MTYNQVVDRVAESFKTIVSNVGSQKIILNTSVFNSVGETGSRRVCFPTNAITHPNVITTVGTNNYWEHNIAAANQGHHTNEPSWNVTSRHGGLGNVSINDTRRITSTPTYPIGSSNTNQFELNVPVSAVVDDFRSFIISQGISNLDKEIETTEDYELISRLIFVFIKTKRAVFVDMCVTPGKSYFVYIRTRSNYNTTLSKLPKAISSISTDIVQTAKSIGELYSAPNLYSKFVLTKQDA